MKLTKSKLKQIIKEEMRTALLSENVINDTAWDAHKIAIKNIQAMSRDLNDKDSYTFLDLLKKWFNNNVLEEQ